MAGLPWFNNVCNNFSVPLNSLNMGTGGDRVELLFWWTEIITASTSVTHVIILCGTNNVLKNSPQDI